MRATRDIADLYAAAYRRLVVQLFAICGDLPEAEDAVQEAFVTAVRKSHQLAAVSDPEAWVRKVAVNRLRGVWRHSAVVRRYQAAIPGPQNEPEVMADHVALVTALAALDADQRLVVVLHHLADLGTAQIAAELGIPEGTVKSRLSRGRSRLAELLHDSEEADHV
jgi:RNA polymerase sigma-70 factor (ECF subfamily)